MGCWFWRPEVRAVLNEPRIRDSQSVFKALLWLAPVFSVGAVGFVFSTYSEAAVNSEVVFLSSMLAIGVIVLAFSRSIAIFLIDAGLLFEEFFARMSRLAIPAFAFLTFYALLVIIFAALYTLISQHATLPHFRVSGELRTLGFSEAVHFSIVTLSTVGYGDIVPASNFSRALASVEVICGVMLLLFGVSELQEYAREHRHDRRANQKPVKPD
jgi:voltage-gated potassium channel